MCCYWTVANVGHNGSVKDEPKETNFLKILDFGSIKCGRRGISLSLDWTLSMETQLHYLNGLENGKCRGSQLCKVQLLMIENIVISSLSLSLSLSLYLPLSIYLPLFWKPRKGTKKIWENLKKKKSENCRLLNRESSQQWTDGKMKKKERMRPCFWLSTLTFSFKNVVIRFSVIFKRDSWWWTHSRGINQHLFRVELKRLQVKSTAS